jgi:N-acylneuraminate cytidylyltransferase
MRQEFAGSFMENGAFYFTKRIILERFGCRLGGRTGVFEMHPETAVELDEPEDWKEIEQLLLRRRHNAFDDILAALRLLVVDIDGTLTDAGMYWSPDGELLKKFNTRDAKGLELIRKCGVQVAIITAEDSPIVMARAKKLGIEYCFTGVSDKFACLGQLCSELGVAFAETAYVGDDINDLECMNRVGFSACPTDAVTSVQRVAKYVSSFMGGSGAVRDICELILKCKR